MPLAARNADDSCLVNQTVPAAAAGSPPEQVRGESEKLPTTTTTNAAAAADVDSEKGRGTARDQTGDGNGRSHGAPPEQQPGVEDDNDNDNDAVEEEEESAADFPEGGREAWLVVAGSWCAMVAVFGMINSAAVFESYFAAHQLRGRSSSAIGWVFSAYLFVVFLAGVQAGPIFDRRGPRALVAAGGLLVVASQMLLGLCTGYYQVFLTYSILGGLGGALLNVPAYGVIAHYFRARRGLATGVAATSGSIGGIVFPLYLQAVLPRLGFAWSTRIIGFVLLLLSAIAILLMRARQLPPSSVTTTRVVPRRRGRRRCGVAAADVSAALLPDWSLFRDPRFSLCCAGVWFMEWGIFVPLTFIVSFAAAHGQEANSAYTLLALLNVGSFFGRFLPGFLADRLGRFNVIIATNALCAVSILALWLPAASVNTTTTTNSGGGGGGGGGGIGANPLLVAFVVAFGFASGSNLGLYPVCVGQLCGARDYGRFYATALMTGSFGTLTSLPIGGALLGVGVGSSGGDDDQQQQNWRALILFAALSYVVAMSCFVGARVVAVGPAVKKVF
ncbi:major facilitator superfamily domain-containing protein [Xylariaceae sp. FL0804]|nr:major facilitator superfamily domain-containing protein [Xylariaceae sp. FL0804]